MHRAPATSLRPPVALTVAQATRVTARAATRVIIGWLPQSRRAACARVCWPCTGSVLACKRICTARKRHMRLACTCAQASVLLAAEACMARCRRCGRCRFVSFSVEHAPQHVRRKQGHSESRHSKHGLCALQRPAWPPQVLSCTASLWAREQSLVSAPLGPYLGPAVQPLKPETPALLLLPLQGDCSWFNSCNLAALRSDVPGFVSAARAA